MDDHSTTDRPVGRPPLPGKGYRFYIRFRPGEHPPELLELLEKAQATRGRQREDILVTALIGGLNSAPVLSEDDEADDLADDLFDIF